MSQNKWKEFILKSGIPLEFEVKQGLDKYWCVSSYDFTYLRKDEKDIINEFSYDLDAAYIKKWGNYFNLKIECKYRHDSTSWLFTPEKYWWIDELEHYSFLNPNDHFTKKNKFKRLNYPQIWPACWKWIEINSTWVNPKTIIQAVNQLNYSIAESILDWMSHQIEWLLWTSEIIFYDVPIIITTAKLFRLNEGISIKEIKSSDNIEDIAKEEDFLILNNSIWKELEQFNTNKLLQLTSMFSNKEIEEKLNTFNDDYDFVASTIAKNYAPKWILVMHYKDHESLKRLFKYLDEVANPTEITMKREEEKQNKIKEFWKT